MVFHFGLETGTEEIEAVIQNEITIETSLVAATESLTGKAGAELNPAIPLSNLA